MGVFQLEDGCWGYRVVLQDATGKRHNKRATRDNLGNKFETKRSATSAMKEYIRRFEDPPEIVRKNKYVTIAEVYEEYCRYGRSDKAFATNRKYDSLWNIHIKEEFGKKFIEDVSVAKINDFLASLYYVDGYAYKYVESFLKFFYLLFGQAYSREYITLERYNKMCVDKGSKIHMPKMKIDEDVDIKAFDKIQIEQLNVYFTGTNVETAYMLGRYCGLRRGECFGLTWDCVDFKNGYINVEKQLQDENGVLKIVPLKTRCSKRQVVMCNVLKDYLKRLYKQREQDKVNFREQREQNEMFFKDYNGNKYSSLDFVNTLSNGKFQGDTALKYHSQMIKKKLKIEFKYHYLRHTFGTTMALLNVPQYLLCNQMGHSKIDVTSKYYLSDTKDAYQLLREKMDNL